MLTQKTKILKMKPNKHLAQTFAFSGPGGLLTNHRSGFFSDEISRAAILTIVLGIIAVLATSCTSTAGGFSTRLITPVANDHSPADAVNNDSYQPARSPAFSDLLGN